MSTIIEIDDVPTQLATTNAVITGVTMLDAEEARQIVKNINGRLDQSRRDLLELYDREGWKALGYGSWGACVKAEFEGSSTALYRQLTAAKIEREMFGDSRIGNPVPASQLEAVKQLAPEQRVEAFKRADAIAGDQPRTAKHIEQAAAEIAAPSPDLADTLLRLDAHGYAKTGTRQKGITTFYSFRDFGKQLDDGETGELELAEGELPYWLSELDDNARRAEARNAQYQDARDRFERLGWLLDRDGLQFVLSSSSTGPKMRGALDSMIKTLIGYEKNAAKRAAEPAAPPLPSEDEQHRVTIEAILKQPHTPALIQQAYDHAHEIHDVDLYNKTISLIDRALDEPSPSPSPRPPSATVSAYDQQEQVDIKLMRAAYDAIEASDYSGAHDLLDQVVLAIYERDQVLRILVRTEAQRFHADQVERRSRFSPQAMISLPTWDKAMALFGAMLEQMT